MNDQDLCKKRLMDLSRQANRKDIVTFSGFLNLNELHIYHSNQRVFEATSQAFGGFNGAERQIIAFIPDALCYEWEYPISYIRIIPKYPKFADVLSHRDILGALMSLGIERSTLGDILCLDQEYILICLSDIAPYIIDNLSQIRHTMVDLSLMEDSSNLSSKIHLEEVMDTIASNRIDCIIAKAFHFSRSESAEILALEKVFVNGLSISNCNHSCEDGAIVSVRGHGRFIFESCNSFSKKGKLRVKFSFYK